MKTERKKYKVVAIPKTDQDITPEVARNLIDALGEYHASFEQGQLILVGYTSASLKRLHRLLGNLPCLSLVFTVQGILAGHKWPLTGYQAMMTDKEANLRAYNDRIFAWNLAGIVNS